MHELVFVSFTCYFAKEYTTHSSSEYDRNTCDWVLKRTIAKSISELGQLGTQGEINRPEKSKADVEDKEVVIFD